MRAAPDEQWHETEQALRRLLHDALPQTAGPADRMTRIRWRVRRRRRRRAAAAGATTAVAAVVACVTLVPGLRPPGEAPTPADAPGQRHALPAATPSPGATGDRTTVRLLSGTGLTLRVPRTWHGLSADDRGTATGFVSSQSLSLPPRASCPDLAEDALPACEPLEELGEDGVLMTFRTAATGKADLAKPLRMSEPAPAGKSCQTVRGDTEILAWGYGRSAAYGKPFEVRIDVCLRAPSDATLTTVTQALETAFPSTGG
ncbi:hypothetical protein ACFV3E_11460 [Streptomyces sp. NPDC059718]